MSKILVVAEHEGGAVKKATLTTLNMARQLADKRGASIDIAVLGSGVSGVADALKGYGAETIHVADHADLANPLAPTWVRSSPTSPAPLALMVTSSASTTGKDILPRVAARLDAGMASDVVGVVDTDDGVGFRRPMWAGALLADVVIDSDIWVVTARGSAFDAAAATGGESAVAAFSAEPNLAASRTRFIRFDGTQSDRPSLDEADIVVAGGRGLKSADGFNQVVEPLADALGAAIGASRAAVDDGFCPNDYQVGQTDKSSRRSCTSRWPSLEPSSTSLA